MPRARLLGSSPGALGKRAGAQGYAGVANTTPLPSSPVSSPHSIPRAASASACSTLLRVPVSRAMRGAHAGSGLGPRHLQARSREEWH